MILANLLSVSSRASCRRLHPLHLHFTAKRIHVVHKDTALCAPHIFHAFGQMRKPERVGCVRDIQCFAFLIVQVVTHIVNVGQGLLHHRRKILLGHPRNFAVYRLDSKPETLKTLKQIRHQKRNRLILLVPPGHAADDIAAAQHYLSHPERLIEPDGTDVPTVLVFQPHHRVFALKNPAACDDSQNRCPFVLTVFQRPDGYRHAVIPIFFWVATQQIFHAFDAALLKLRFFARCYADLI